MLTTIKQQGYQPVVYINYSDFSSLSHTSLMGVLDRAKKLGVKVYNEKNDHYLLKLRKPWVMRYGHLQDRISGKINMTGGKVVSGNL